LRLFNKLVVRVLSHIKHSATRRVLYVIKHSYSFIKHYITTDFKFVRISVVFLVGFTWIRISKCKVLVSIRGKAGLVNIGTQIYIHFTPYHAGATEKVASYTVPGAAKNVPLFDSF
jgi:hypothetical protein